MKIIRSNQLYIVMGFMLSASILKANSELKNPIGWNLNNLRNLQPLQTKTARITSGGDLIIGQDNPGEVVNITGSYVQNGNITIVNQGVLNITEADFRLDGDIYIAGSGQMNVTGSSFTVVQEYIYEHSAIILDNAKLIFEHVEFRSNGQSWSIGAAGQAEYTMQYSNVEDGFITCGLLENAKAVIHECETPGEFLCFGQSSVSFTDSDFLLMWLVLPENSSVDLALPGDSLVTDWAFSDQLSGIDGTDWEASINNCTHVMWGLISISGSEAVFRDTDFRTIGLMFSHPDSINMSNITNQSVHADETIRVEDRDLRLIDCTVQTWSVYGSVKAIVGIQNCILGEIMAMDTSRIWVDNSICDGSGGYASTFQNGFMVFTSSLIRSQLIARNTGVLVAAMSSILGTDIDADEEAIMFLANTDWFTEPQAHQSAAIFEAQMPYFEGDINSSVPIFGTARLLAGPDSPIEFAGYQIHYSSQSGSNLPVPVHSLQTEPVTDDLLAEWNTNGLEAGSYSLTLSLYHNFGDSISMGSWARLNPSSDVPIEAHGNALRFELGQNYPNPFNGMTIIPFSLSEPSEISVAIYDIRGRQIKTIRFSEFGAGEHTVQIDGEDLPSGHYYYVVRGDNFQKAGTMLVVK